MILESYKCFFTNLNHISKGSVIGIALELVVYSKKAISSKYWCVIALWATHCKQGFGRLGFMGKRSMVRSF